MLSSRAILVGVQSAGGVLAGRDGGHKRCRPVLLPLFTELPRETVRKVSIELKPKPYEQTKWGKELLFRRPSSPKSVLDGLR